jgi:hypothetical protein
MATQPKPFYFFAGRPKFPVLQISLLYPQLHSFWIWMKGIAEGKSNVVAPSDIYSHDLLCYLILIAAVDGGKEDHLNYLRKLYSLYIDVQFRKSYAEEEKQDLARRLGLSEFEITEVKKRLVYVYQRNIELLEDTKPKWQLSMPSKLAKVLEHARGWIPERTVNVKKQRTQ